MSSVVLEAATRWYGSVLGLGRVDLSFEPGVTALLGPNGAGKSTLLKLAAGLLRPSSGRVRVLGEDPFANPGVARKLGLVPEEEELRVRVTASEWIELLLRLTGFDEDTARGRAETVLRDVGLGDVASSRVTSLSRGMKQRLRIAQAIAHDPEILILDEPLAGLDPVGRNEILAWIRRFGAESKTVIVSSHILHEVELMTREVVLMTAGRVLASGNIHEIRELMDAHPHRIRLSTPEPKTLARRLLAEEGLLSIAFNEELEWVELETRKPDRFYALVSELVLDEGAVVNEISSPDDNLASVFHYLMGS